MADLDKIMTALRNAHAAGDTAAAKRLAAMAKAAQGAAMEAAPAAPPPTPAQSPEMAGKLAYLSSKFQSAVAPPEPRPVQSPGEVFMGNLANGVSFGFADEIAAGLGSLGGERSYDEILKGLRQQNANQKEDAPMAALGGEIAGAVAMPIGALKSTGKLGLDIAKGGLTGAGLSGLYGFGTGDGGYEERANAAREAAIWGGGIGALVPGIGALVQKGLNSRAVSKAIKDIAANAPTTEAQKAAAKAAYQAVDDAGVMVNPSAMSTVVQDMTEAMRGNGLRMTTGRELSPKAAGFAESAMDIATDPAFKAGIPFSEVETIRKLAKAPAASKEPLDAALGAQAVNYLDDFVENLTPAQVTQGKAEELAPLITAARSAYQKAAKSATIDTVIEKADGYLGGTASGIRNQFGTMLKNPKKYLKGFTPLEVEAMKRVVNGSALDRAIILAGGGLGKLATATTGFGAGGLPGLLAGGIIGSGAQKLADKVVSGKAETLRALVANGGAGLLPVAPVAPRGILEAILQRTAASGVNQ
jgi:hypothetical protein